MANLHAPNYTHDQDRRIRDGRKRLVERWSTETFSVGQTRTFRVEFRSSCRERDGQFVDVFRASPATAAFQPVWQREVDSNRFRVEHGSRLFEIIVPHSHYLDRRWLPFSIDRQCLLTSTVLVSTSLFFAWVAVRIGLD